MAEQAAADRTDAANLRIRRIETIARRWGHAFVPDVVNIFDNEVRLYHATYVQASVFKDGLRGRAYLEAEGIVHYPRIVGKRRADLLQTHTVLSVTPLGWLVDRSSRVVIEVEPIAAALDGAFWISPEVARGGYDFGDGNISRDVSALQRWMQDTDRGLEIWVPFVPPELFLEIRANDARQEAQLARWVREARLSARIVPLGGVLADEPAGEGGPPPNSSATTGLR